MRVFTVVLFAILCVAQPARAERLWLVIGASDPSPAGIAIKAQHLGQHIPTSFVVRTTDCGDKRNVYAVVTEATGKVETAQATLSHLKTIVKDAYIKRCDAKPGTLLALRVTVIDPSIANVPRTAVNWQDEDRLSTAHVLPDGRTLVIARYFVSNPDDPLEGRRERIIVAESPDKLIVLKDNCISPGGIVARNRDIAFHCAKEQAGDHLIHDVVVFDESGRELTTSPRCRNPAWSNNGRLTCEDESVGPDGRLDLRVKTIDLTR